MVSPELLVNPSDEELSQHLLAPLWSTSWIWLFLFAVTGAGTLLLLFAMTWTFSTGIGSWGNNIPNGWAFGIINFVWWIGIGHAGTFISAFLLLLQQPWRASINRVAEAMTLFAVANAALFPLLHLGRPWFAYWLVPYPATMQVWPQFRSALPWDFAAILTYGTVSLLFWYVGLIPDLATARDRAPTRAKQLTYGIFALGWRGSARAWQKHGVAYGLLAGIATPLVISVHSIVSMDFAITQLPGWHSTIFPPYFVAGALYSGFAMVIMLTLPVRRVFHLEAIITERHLDSIGKLALAMGWAVIYAYVIEAFVSWYSGNLYERFALLIARPLGPYALLYWVMLTCNCLAPQLLWSRRARTTPWLLFVIALMIQAGMWLERFIIIVSSLSRDFLPSSWHDYRPTWVDLSLLMGSISFFLLLFLLFLRFVPAIPISEVKHLKHETADKGAFA